MDDDPDLYPYVSGDACTTGCVNPHHGHRVPLVIAINEFPCPAWADGQHCYVDKVTTLGVAYGGQFGKRCACGKTVARSR